MKKKRKGVLVNFTSSMVPKCSALIFSTDLHLTSKEVWCLGISKSEHNCQTHDTFREGRNQNQTVLQAIVGNLHLKICVGVPKNQRNASAKLKRFSSGRCFAKNQEMEGVSTVRIKKHCTVTTEKINNWNRWQI